MSEQVKPPGLSNEEFIWKCREGMNQMGAWKTRQEMLEECLDRLEALIGQGKPTPGQIGAIDGDKLVEFIQGLLQIRLDEMDERKTAHEQSWIEGSRHTAMEIRGHIQSGRFSVTGQGQEEREDLRAVAKEALLTSKPEQWGTK